MQFLVKRRMLQGLVACWEFATFAVSEMYNQRKFDPKHLSWILIGNIDSDNISYIVYYLILHHWIHCIGSDNFIILYFSVDRISTLNQIL